MEELPPWLESQRREGREVLTFASRRMWTSQLDSCPPDEIHLMVGPEALGGGTALFDGRVRLHLLDIRRFEDSPNVLLSYGIGSGRSGD